MKSARNIDLETTDVLIIGSGISGLMCALQLSPKTRITILSKKALRDTATTMAQGGVAAVTKNSKDSFAQHTQDTLIAGEHHNDIKAVKEVVHAAPEIIEALRDLGVPFDSKQTLEGGHSHSRIHHTKDTTGKNIEKYLLKAIKSRRNIEIIESGTAIDLITHGKRCTGCYYLKDGAIHTIRSAITILATGGAGQVFAHTTNPLVSTGDGIAMASRAGVATRDLEFIQFHPTALLDIKNPHFLLSESLRGEGAILRNAKGEAFMKQYDARGDLAPRDKVSQAIFLEQKDGPVFLDITHKSPTETKERFPILYKTTKALLGIDMTKKMIPVTPAAHYLCGGVDVDSHGETSLPNLFAIGETARTGLHGANRLASNSLLEGAVYGTKVADYINTKRLESPKNSRNQTASSAKIHTPYQISTQPFRSKTLRNQIQQTMWNSVGIRRTPANLKLALQELHKIENLLPKPHLINAEILLTRNLVHTAILITKAALARKKSLGCHWIDPAQQTHTKN